MPWWCRTWDAPWCETPVRGRRTRDREPIGSLGGGRRRVTDGTPARPGVTDDGASGRPQAAKLGLKPGQRVGLCDPPPGWALADPPAGLLDAEPAGPADLIIAFFT